MTVSSTQNVVSFAGDGVTVAFSTAPVKFYASSDLKVYLEAADGTQTLQTISTHYSVAGGNGATGTVTMVAAPAAGQTLRVQRVLPVTQEIDPVNGDRNDAEVLEEALDRAIMVSQQLNETIARALLLPLGSAAVSFPSPSASKHLRWKADLTGLENVDLVGTGTVGLPVPVASGGTGATTVAGARAAFELDTPIAQCALEYVNSTTVRLVRRGGKKLYINASLYDIPSAGVDLANSALGLNDTAYYVYAYMNSGTMTLEVSTTGYARDAAAGHMVKSGDATRTLVGMVAKSAGVFVDTPSKRYVRSWYNDLGVHGLAQLAASENYVGGSAWVATTAQAALLAWAGETVYALAAATGSHGSLTSYLVASVAVDSTLPISTATAGVATAGTNQYVTPVGVAVHSPSEGLRVYKLAVYVPASDTWAIGGASGTGWPRSGITLTTSGTRP